MVIPKVEVVVVSNELDVSVDWVVRHLRSRGVNVLRLNTEKCLDWTVEAVPTTGEIRIDRGDGMVSLADLQALWYRRPMPPKPTGALSEAEERVLTSQWEAVVSGICQLPGIRLVNNPGHAAAGESKLAQLHIASRLGFRVPPTLITNRKDAIRSFATEHGRVILKGLDAPFVDDPAAPRFVFTTRLTDELLASAAERELTPLIVQPEIQDKLDVRVTVVNGNAFAAETLAPPNLVDWRRSDQPPSFRAHRLPPEISELCCQLTAQMGLVFAAIDLLLNTDGYTFLEVNPSGEWGWLQKGVGLPIAEAIASALCP